MVAAAVRADPDIRDVAIILLTSMGHWSEIQKTEGVGVDACLLKPVRQSQLMSVLAATWTKKFSPECGRPQESHQARPNAERLFGGTNFRVLLAEDNVVNQKVAVRMLERFGLRVDVACNGQEAVRMVKLLPYDLIFMDCQMPEMDGYEATGAIRRLEESQRHVPIIALTAEAMDDARERCLQAGMDDHITKPIRPKDLAESVRKWVCVATPAPSPAPVAPVFPA
jgi:CheY-like chemotaxis protein